MERSVTAKLFTAERNCNAPENLTAPNNSSNDSALVTRTQCSGNRPPQKWGPGGLIGDMRDVIPKGWKRLGTSYEVLATAPPGIGLGGQAANPDRRRSARNGHRLKMFV
jgi:hypothetical protein